MDREIATRPETQITHTGVGDSLLLPLFSFWGIDVNGSKKLFPNPECE